MNYSKGDLVVFIDGDRKKKTGIITSKGSNVSLYIEDRPYKIIDTVPYRIVSEGIVKSIYDYQISEVLSKKDIENV
tara:strand:- start:6 stop:233 length:228 start_codon:yes stop_codon:yes gene_type:complete